MSASKPRVGTRDQQTFDNRDQRDPNLGNEPGKNPKTRLERLGCQMCIGMHAERCAKHGAPRERLRSIDDPLLLRAQPHAHSVSEAAVYGICLI